MSSLQEIKSAICSLLNLDSISANEAKQLNEAKDLLNANWSKKDTWQALLTNLQNNTVIPVEASVPSKDVENVESITEQVESVIEPSSNESVIVSAVLKADNFIELVIANKVYLYHEYKVNDIKFNGGTKVKLFSQVVEDTFVLKKENKKYTVSFKGVYQSFDNTLDLFSFDWLKLSNYYYELLDQGLTQQSDIYNYTEENIEYRSIKITNISNATHLLLNVSNFKQSTTESFSGKSIKTFKDWLRVIYLEIPAKYLISLFKGSTTHELFKNGLRRNYSLTKIDTLLTALMSNPVDKITGKILNKNSGLGSKATFYSPHTITDKIPKRAGEIVNTVDVKLSRVEDRYTPTVESFFRLPMTEVFKILDIELDLSSYLRYPAFIGHWKLVVISQLLGRRSQFSLTTDWMRIVSNSLRINADTHGSYVLVEELDPRRFNNKVRLTSTVVFKLPEDSSGKYVRTIGTASKLLVMEGKREKHSNMLSSNGRPKSVKNTNKGGKQANYVKIAETNNYEIRLFYLEEGSKQKPHKYFKEVLANLVYVEKQTTISNNIGAIWIKQARSGDNVLCLVNSDIREKINKYIDNDVQRKILSAKKQIERISSKIKELRTTREDGKLKQFNLSKGIQLDQDSAELKRLIQDKIKLELEIKGYDLELPSEVVLTCYELGINLLTDGIVNRQLDWQRIFSYLKLDIPAIKDNAIKVIYE